MLRKQNLDQNIKARATEGSNIDSNLRQRQKSNNAWSLTGLLLKKDGSWELCSWIIWLTEIGRVMQTDSILCKTPSKNRSNALPISTHSFSRAASRPWRQTGPLWTPHLYKSLGLERRIQNAEWSEPGVYAIQSSFWRENPWWLACRQRWVDCGASEVQKTRVVLSMPFSAAIVSTCRLTADNRHCEDIIKLMVIWMVVEMPRM